jgi:hypothetical protein
VRYIAIFLTGIQAIYRSFDRLVPDFYLSD